MDLYFSVENIIIQVKFQNKSEITGDICAGSNSEQDSISGYSDKSTQHVLSAPNTASNSSASGSADINETTWQSAVDAT
jgi:hypothetical protein